MYNKRKYLKANDKKVLHKVKKQWVTISLALLMAIGGGAVATHVSASADTTNQPKAVNIQSSASSATSNKASSASSSASSQVASSSATSSSANQPNVSLTLGNPAPTVPYSVINPTYNQNFHFNVKQGTFGDIEGIVPQMNGSKVSSYNVYNMENPRPDASYWDFSWSRYNTPDFSHFTPVNNTNNNNNVAISGNTFMGYMTSGSIINNNGKLTHDTYGHTIAPNAHLAYFANNYGANIWLAYSNNGKQYQPYSNNPVISEGNYGISGDFRDPFIMRNPKNNNELDAYIAGGTHHNIFVFTSNDGIHWNHNTNNDIYLNGSGVSETPNIQVLDGKPVMFTSCEPLWPSNVIGYVYYTNGYFDNNGLFKADSNTITKLDTGLDNYAPSYVPVDNNTIVGIGKLQDWGYSPNGDTLHLGSFLLPRIIQRNNDDMEVTPIETGALNQVSSKSLNANDNLNVDAHNKLSVNFNQPVSQFNLDLKRNDGTNNNIDFSLNDGALTIHRQDNDLNSHQDETRTTALGTNQLSNIEFYLDNDSVEAYVPEIHKVFTWADYTGTQNATYTLNTNVPVQANVYDFNLSQAPTLDNINNISAQYSSDKSQLNNDLNTINGNLSGNDANSANTDKSLLDSYFNDINNDLSNAQANIDKYNNYNNDARQHVFTALANSNMDMANIKLYQASFQLNALNNLSNSINTNNSNYITNDYAYDLTPDSFTNVDGFLTAHSWYRPKGIHQNGTNWRPSQRTNVNDYHDFRPVLMHWWPSKNVQIDYLNYMHQHGMASQIYSNSDSQSQLNQAANEVQDNIEKQISQNGNNGMNNATETLFNNFINSEPQWNMSSEDYIPDTLQGGYLKFVNNNLTPYANSQYRLLNRNGTYWQRTHSNNVNLEFLLGNDIDNSNPAVQAEDLNNMYYINNIGSILANNPKGNFDGFREDATLSMDYDVVDLMAQYLTDKYHMNNNDANADAHISILEDGPNGSIESANRDHNEVLTQDESLQGMLESCLVTNTRFSLNNLVNAYINRSNDFTENQAVPNYSRVNFHDNGALTNTIAAMGKSIKQSNPSLTPLEALQQATNTFVNGEFDTVKPQSQYYNIPAAYAVLLTNKDTVPQIYYGDLFKANAPYMTQHSPYYDAISALLKARKKYVAGGQQMNTYDGGSILSSVRFGKDDNFTNNYSDHQILKPTDDAHTSNDPTTGLAIIVNNNPNLNPSSSITVNMGAAHGNQEYKPLMISANTSDGFNFNSTERLTTNDQGQLVIPANDLKGYKNPQNSGSLSVWVPANAPENQDARTNPSLTTSKDGKVLHSNAALDSHVLYESFSAFLPITNNRSQQFDQVIARNAPWLQSLGITDLRFPPHYMPVKNDSSFVDALDQNGYAFSDRYNFGNNGDTKYGNVQDMINANIALHKASTPQNPIHTLADLVDNQLYDLPKQEVVSVNRSDYSGNNIYSYIMNKLYSDNADSSGHDYQAEYGGKYLKQLEAKYPDLFNMIQVSTGQKINPNTQIKQWSAKYENCSNLEGHGMGNVLHDLSNKYYMVNNTGHSYVPTAFASINQQTDDNYAQAGASAADAQIAQHQKASVANSVAQANQKAAQNAAHAADENILNQQKASVAASVRAANQQKANQAAQQADQRIAQQQRTSVANSVAAANRAKANHAAQVADQNILNQQKQSVANSVNAANQAKAKDAAQKADQIIANSVATSVATANHQAATSAANVADKSIENSIASSYAKSADTSIVNSYKNSINASVSAANSSYAKTTAGKAAAKSDASSADKSIESSIASSYAKSADNSIANSYKNSVNASVSSANQSRANSAASAADQSIENSEEAKNAQNTIPVTPSPAPFVPMFNPVTPSSETEVSNSSASSTVMPANESASEYNTSNKATRHITHHNNTHKIALIGVNKRAYFTGKHFEAKFTPKMRKHATVLEATIKSNHSVAYKVRVGKHVGYVYGYLTKLAKPSFFMYKNHAYIHFGKKAIRIYTKNFKFIRINKSIQYNNHKYIRYDVTYGRKHGVMYGKLPAVKKVSHSKYYQLMPKHYHYAKVIKPLCIYNSKYFSKRTRRGVISKGITVRIKRVVKADKTTRFELTNGKFITGLRNFTKLV